jgi:hypothetical protein
MRHGAVPAGELVERAELIDVLFDPTKTIDDLDWLRSSWDGPLVVTGIRPWSNPGAWSPPTPTWHDIAFRGGHQLIF